MEVEHRKIIKKYKEWRCGSCNKLLGIIHNNGVLAIKYKDFVGYVLKGDFKMICTFCKSENNYTHNKLVDV